MRACCAGIWKARSVPSATDSSSSHSRRIAPCIAAAHSSAAMHRLAGETDGQDARALMAVDHVARHQHQQQRRQELKQADESQVPGRAGQVVHLPADRDHQHLAAGGAGQTGEPQAHEAAVEKRETRRTRTGPTIGDAPR